MTTTEQQAEQQQEAPAKPEPTDPYAETRAMSYAYTQLAELDRPAQLRALRWLSDRLDADDRTGRTAGDPWNERPF